MTELRDVAERYGKLVELIASVIDDKGMEEVFLPRWREVEADGTEVEISVLFINAIKPLLYGLEPGDDEFIEKYEAIVVGAIAAAIGVLALLGVATGQAYERADAAADFADVLDLMGAQED